MPADVGELNSKIERAATDGHLRGFTGKNIQMLLAGAPSDIYRRSIEELANGNEWSELNDRFYQTLAFGTGGLRGRTVGKIVTTAERGPRRAR